MTRQEELSKVKDIVQNYIDRADHGIYDTHNWSRDHMDTLYDGEYFRVDICYEYRYFEVLGMTDDEFETIRHYYNHLI